jgi:hypothetical protein
MPRGEPADQNVLKPADNSPQPAPLPAEAPAPPAPVAAAQPDPKPAEPPVQANVTIKSEPEGAELYRDGALIGNTPFSMQKPKDRERVDLEVRLAGYEAKAFSITAFTREELKLTLDKQKAPARRSGSSRRNDGEQSDKPKPEKPRRGADTEVLDPWD